MMKLGPVDHVTLNVADMTAAVEFYRKLGMQVEGSLDNGDIVFLWNGNEEDPLHIQLDQCHGDMRPGLNHIAFTMPDLETAAEEVKATGIEPLDQDFYDPDTGRTFFTPDPCYDKRSGRTIFSFNDLSGVGLQFAREDGRGEYKDFK